MRRLIAALPLLLFLSPAWGAIYYFSDCPVGCLASGSTCGGNVGNKGTVGDPWCLDAENTGHAYSAALMTDGVAGSTTRVPEVAAGDTIYLCAGACDGAGSGVYHIAGTPLSKSNSACEENNAWLVPRYAGTNGNPITIAAYPGETVDVSGDTNADGIPEIGTDADSWISLCDTHSVAPSYWTFSGFTMSHATSWGVHGYQSGYGPGNPWPGGWVFDHMILERLGPQAAWSAQSIWQGTPGGNSTTGCGVRLADQFIGGVPYTRTNEAINFSDIQTLTISHTTIRHVCGFGTRIVTNPDATDIEITDGEFYNMVSASNDFSSNNEHWLRNYVHDTYQGIDLENGTQHATIQGNKVWCLGQYIVDSTQECQTGITVTDGDTPGDSTLGTEHDIYIGGNDIRGLSASGPGAMVEGIALTARCSAAAGCSTSNWTVENNMVLNVRGNTGSTGMCAYTNAGCIFVCPLTPLACGGCSTDGTALVRFNTVRECGNVGIAALGGSHVIDSNIISETANGGATWVPLVVDADTLNTSNVTYNEIEDSTTTGTGAVNLVAKCSDVTCNNSPTVIASSDGSTAGSVAIASFGVSNHSIGTHFCDITSADPTRWNAHLCVPSPVVCGGADPVYPAQDIDNTSRPGSLGPCIGADELSWTSLQNNPPQGPVAPVVIQGTVVVH